VAVILRRAQLQDDYTVAAAGLTKALYYRPTDCSYRLIRKTAVNRSF